MFENAKKKKSLLRKKSRQTSANVLKSFQYAFHGLIYCFKSSRNFRIHIFSALFAFIVSLILNINLNDFLIIIATIFSVLILELINTSIESLVDLIVEEKFDRLAKVAKDCSAAAVLLASINSIFVASSIFFPKIKLLLFG
tara:strand:+ start:105 stop:527 length:423 start_codon:yes stop_codon:yes gene_type:complete